VAPGWSASRPGATPPTAVARGPTAAHRRRVTMVAGQSKGSPARQARARGRAVSTTGAGPVCNRNRVPAVDCHDGLWGQVAVWPPSLVRVAWGARGASALSPLVAAGSHRPVMGRGGTASHLTVFLQSLAGLPAGVVPARAQTVGRAGALILPKAGGDRRDGQRVALPRLPFGILSIPPAGPAYGLNSSKATRTARPAWAYFGTRPDTATLLLGRPRSRTCHCASEGSHNS
jgi:hypothetical protein